MRQIASSWGRGSAHSAPPSRLRRATVAAPLVVGVLAALSASYEMAAAQISSTTADASTALLEGHSLDHGNLLLHGWSLSLDSFWGLEALAYALILPFTGIHLYVLHLEPALVAAAVFASGVLLAAVDQRRRAVALSALVLLALVAFPSPDLTYFLLQGPWHITTAFACFLAFYLVANNVTYLRAAIAGLILAIASTSDATALVLGIVPVFVVGFLQLIRTRQIRVALPMFSAGGVAVVLVALVHELGKHVGMYTLVNRNLVISTKQLRLNLRLVVPHLRALLGIGSVPIPAVSQHFGGYSIVRGTLAAGVVVAALVGLFRVGRFVVGLRHAASPMSRGRLVEALLLTFFVLDLVFFVVGSANGHVEFTKYLTPGVLAIFIVAARGAGEWFATLPRFARRAFTVVGVVCVGLCAGQYFSVATKPAPNQESHQLATFVVTHHLGAGVASYPIASLVSVDTSLNEPLRPISTNSGLITTFGRQEDASWYTNTTFDYLVFDPSVPWHGVNLTSAQHTFGAVAHVYVVGPYRVVTWSHRIRIQPSPVASTSVLHVIFHL